MGAAPNLLRVRGHVLGVGARTGERQDAGTVVTSAADPVPMRVPTARDTGPEQDGDTDGSKHGPTLPPLSAECLRDSPRKSRERPVSPWPMQT